ncbi:MAG: ABC transporter permease [Saprospiraceae bacterium]|nr:ABC transporter permease [Saprospiraceae bacterium]
MSKLGIIVKREYLSRVTKRSFIIGTLMAPLGFLIYMLVIVGLTKYESGGELKVALLDESGMVNQLPDGKGIRFIQAGTKSLEQLKSEVTAKQLDGIVQVPKLSSLQSKTLTIFYYSDNKLAPEKSSMIEQKIAKRIREGKAGAMSQECPSINLARIETLDTKVSIDPESINGKDDNDSKYTAGVGLAVGGIMAFIMMFMVMMYGQMVMRSVMEEKTNRIVEVMMSSVRPFELMLGKILGAGGVGLTQVLIWIFLGGGITLLLPFIMGGVDPSSMQAPMTPGDVPMPDAEQMEGEGLRLMAELGKQNWMMLGTAFVIFFLGGYFIYASLFAAIGSAMGDDMGESQSLVLPIMIPILLATYIVAFAGVRNPHSGLMIAASMFPLTSPIVMPFRMAFFNLREDWWQLALSLIIVVASAWFFVWLSGRIYRVGILLYVKKVSFKEIGKWMFYKG